MIINLHKAEENLTSKWSGGTTTEIAIWPADSKYENRDFSWRISSATVEQEETVFTQLPDYDRILLVLEGEVILSFEGERITRLSQYNLERFSGSSRTRSYGKLRDFNLIYCKNGDAFMEILELNPEKTRLHFENHLTDEYGQETQFFYCLEDFGIITLNQQEYLIKKGEALVCTGTLREAPDFGIMGMGKLVHGIIRYDDPSTSEEAEVKKEKPTLDDLKLAAYLSLTDFRGSKYLFKGTRDYWQDKALKKAMGRMEKTMLPFILGMIGMVVTAALVHQNMGADYVLPALGIWFVVDLFLINPLLYLMLLPKPIRSHMKKIEELSEKERKSLEEERNTNQQAEKILKKYAITGRNKYND